jgi:hypothetical protein
VITVLLISALSVSGAIFIVLDMTHPLQGVIKVSSTPMRKALEHLGSSDPQACFLRWLCQCGHISGSSAIITLVYFPPLVLGNACLELLRVRVP